MATEGAEAKLRVLWIRDIGNQTYGYIGCQLVFFCALHTQSMSGIPMPSSRREQVVGRPLNTKGTDCRESTSMTQVIMRVSVCHSVLVLFDGSASQQHSSLTRSWSVHGQ
jgi:hypothetical protein